MELFHGVLVGKAVLVLDVEEARRLYSRGFYGKFIGYDKVKPNEVNTVNAPLHLSILEALYLMERGLLRIMNTNGDEVPREELVKLGREVMRNFDHIYGIYKELRDGKYVVKSGLKFGSLFAVYEKGPGIDHAPVLLHFIEPNREITALDVTRAARLSHSVNKRFVLATYNEAEVRMDYIAFEWWTP
jgi:tRNA-intron endonuclease